MVYEGEVPLHAYVWKTVVIKADEFISFRLAPKMGYFFI
jgi:hypothetical protein